MSRLSFVSYPSHASGADPGFQKRESRGGCRILARGGGGPT